LRPVIYVTGVTSGRHRVAGLRHLAMNAVLDTVRVGGTASTANATTPDRLDETSLKWDGEWQVTIEVTRPVAGVRCGAAVDLLLAVGWFQSTVPLVIMADPAHSSASCPGTRSRERSSPHPR
jgi:hypothetical protein